MNPTAAVSMLGTKISQTSNKKSKQSKPKAVSKTAPTTPYFPRSYDNRGPGISTYVGPRVVIDPKKISQISTKGGKRKSRRKSKKRHSRKHKRRTLKHKRRSRKHKRRSRKHKRRSRKR